MENYKKVIDITATISGEEKLIAEIYQVSKYGGVEYIFYMRFPSDYPIKKVFYECNDCIKNGLEFVKQEMGKSDDEQIRSLMDTKEDIMLTCELVEGKW